MPQPVTGPKTQMSEATVVPTKTGAAASGTDPLPPSPIAMIMNMTA